MYEIEKIKQAQLYTDPYPHLVIDNFFHRKTYAKILKNFPSLDHMAKSAKYSHQVDIVRDPGVLRAADGKWEYEHFLPDIQQKYWDWFKGKFFFGEFPKALKEKFSITDSSYACGRLVSESQGAGLGPHMDRFDKFVSMVVYLDENPKAKGTYLLKAKSPDFKPEEKHYSYEEFDIVKDIEYKPNRLIAWKVVPNSFHSYYQDEETERRTLKYFIQHVEDISKLQQRILATKQHADDWREDVRQATEHFNTK